MIERICQQCEKHFFVKPSVIRAGYGIFCSKSCARKGKPSHMSEEGRLRAIEVHRNYRHSAESKYKISIGNTGKHRSIEQKRKLSLAAKGRFSDPLNTPWYGKHLSEEHKRKISKANKGRHRSAEVRNKMSLDRKLQWEDPEYIRKTLVGINRKPTRPEKHLETILNKNFPQFKYNGDYRLGVSLAGLIPDFVNVNGRKEVIELFGDYWHSEKAIKLGKWHRTELGRIMAYNSLGYRCLVIWEWELNELTKEEIIEKIAKFFRRRHVALAST